MPRAPRPKPAVPAPPGEAPFRAAVDQCCALLTPLLGAPIRHELYPPREAGASAPSAAGSLDLRAMLRGGGDGRRGLGEGDDLGAPACK